MRLFLADIPHSHKAQQHYQPQLDDSRARGALSKYTAVGENTM
jgi:hypothetical protein